MIQVLMKQTKKKVWEGKTRFIRVKGFVGVKSQGLVAPKSLG